MSIRLLDPILVQRIAAGEVIDRPASVVRELLDNSIDAGATSISVWIEGGGSSSITVSDNGKGMSEQDLKMSCHSHATSKIAVLDDLFRITTMGFRGEALYSIAACSRMTIASNGKAKTVDNASETPVSDEPSVPFGTRIRVEELFSRLPARKLFLKRPVTEASMCRGILVQKALAFPGIEFRMFSDGELKVHLPAAEHKQRVIDVLSHDEAFLPGDVSEFNAENENFMLYGVGTVFESHRRDRSQIRVFVNNHCVDDFPLVNAVTTGYSEQFPGGMFPYFCLFITINPELVDFNIHPAKRECRIRIKSQIQGWITTMIRSQLRKVIRVIKPESPAGIEGFQPDMPDIEESMASSELRQNEPGFFPAGSESVSCPAEESNRRHDAPAQRNPQNASYHGASHGWQDAAPRFDPKWFENAKSVVSKHQSASAGLSQFSQMEKRAYRYIGQAFRLFLVVEKEDKLLFVDQHAAHERVLFDEFKKNPQIQRLLIPYRFEVERDTDSFLLEASAIYSDYGIELTRPEELLWEIDTLPLIAKGVEDKIASFIKDSTGDIEEVEKGLFSTLACRAAIKAGDELDVLSALSLLDKVFAMEKPVCPHGRVFVTEMSEQSLREAVGRFS